MKTFDLGAITAYAIAVEHGFKGTEAEWVAYMQSNAAQAKEAETNAKQYAENAKASETAADKSAQSAQTAETNAKASEQNAAKSAQDAQEAARKAGGVQSVNGKTPDENGNVEIDSVASWNDLPDKPFGEESGIVEILPETIITFDGDSTEADITPLPLVGGNTYVVNWNGVEHTCVAQDLSAMVGAECYTLGNHKAMGMEDTGEPFIISSIPSYGMGTIGAFDGSTSVTISIKGEGTTVKTIDPKFLPDGVPYVESGGFADIPFTYEWYDDECGITTPLGLEVGKSYIVTWNGVDYEVVGEDASAVFEGLPAVGLGDFDMTTAPFCIIGMGEEAATMFGAYGVAFGVEVDVPFSIKGEQAIIRKLDNRCLDLEWLPVGKTEKAELYAYGPKTSADTSFLLDGFFEPKIGETYIVNWNGVDYKSTARDGATIDAQLANIVVMLNNEANLSTGKGLIFQIRSGTDGAVAIANDGSNELTLLIYREVKTPNKLPEEFLPESVDGVIIRSSTEGSTKKFKLTVDDSGTIAATEVSE